MAGTWWVASQDTATGIKYIVVSSGNNQFPSGSVVSGSEVGGPYATRAQAQSALSQFQGLPNASSGGGFGANVPTDDAAARNNNALWYCFQGIGRAYLVRRGSAAAGSADTSGVHGYSTIESAYANPNTVNSASQLTITAWNADSSSPAGGGTIGIVETVSVTPPTVPGGQPNSTTAQNPSAAALNNAIPGLAQIGDFFSSLGQAGTWVRVGEVVLGIILLAVGISKMTNAVPVATKIAKKAGAVAVL